MPDSLDKARQRGAEIQIIPKLVDVKGLSDVAKQLNSLIEQIVESHLKQNEALVATVQTLITTIEEKELSSEGFDMTELVDAVRSLKKEVTHTPIPSEWVIDFDRDQRGLMKTGVTIKAMPRVLN